MNTQTLECHHELLISAVILPELCKMCMYYAYKPNKTQISPVHFKIQETSTF